jgi:hypothetical protein
MSVFSLFTTKGGSEADVADSSPPLDPDTIPVAGGNGETPQTPSQEPPKKESSWKDKFGNLLNLSWLASDSKSGALGGSHEESVAHALSVLYYVFLVIVLVFVIDQTCRGESEPSMLAKFNPFVS